MARHPDDLRYTEKHHWVRPGEKLVEIGITQSAADELGTVSFVEMPYPGELFKSGALLGRISGASSSKALFMPFVGQVNAVNKALSDAPDLINQDPYGTGWIVRLEPADLADVEALPDAAGYEATLTAKDD